MTTRIQFFTDARAFADRTTAFLCRREADNNIILGNIGRLTQSDAPPAPPDTLMLAAVDAATDELVAVAMRTPPHNILFTDAGGDVVETIADALDRAGVEIPGVVAPVAVANAFTDAWLRRRPDFELSPHRVSLRLYQLDRVTPPPWPAGTFHRATIDELDLLVEWGDAFTRELELERGIAPPPDGRERMRSRVEAGLMFLWRDEHGGATAMCGCVGRTPNGVRIAWVYTPPDLRRRGYATACVARASQRMLDDGRRFCFLYTDLTNPTSNSIYQRIGYRPVSDWAHYDFAPRDAR